MKLPSLYSRTAKGKVEIWTIEIQGDSYRTISGEYPDGKMSESKWKKRFAKNTGKANATTVEEQAVKEAQSKWDKKAKSGYFENVKDVDNAYFIEPMLAEKFELKKEKKKGTIAREFLGKTIIHRVLDFPVVSQKKYNGTRFIRSIKGAHSRNGEQFHNSDHIVKSTQPLFDKYPELVLDGEQYNHDLRHALNRLARVVSVVRKPKDLTPELRDESESTVRYYVYDGYGFEGITEQTPYLKRIEGLRKLLKGVKYVVIVESVICNNYEELDKEYNLYVSEGYEGQMIRISTSIYAHGPNRTENLLKRKHFEDGEFKVVEIQEGEGNWAGKAKTIVCETANGKRFNSNILGDEDYLEGIWNTRKEHVGKMATIKYQQLSEYGIPQIPWIQTWRDYE